MGGDGQSEIVPDDEGSTKGSGDDGAEIPPMDINGARKNFAAVVEAYVAEKSSNGYWTYVEKKGGKKAKSRRLKLPAVVEGSIKQKKEDNLFSGLVKLRDARGGRSLTLEFLVDFSDKNWRVISAKPAASS